jgi:hypothetical protein
MSKPTSHVARVVAAEDAIKELVHQIVNRSTGG